MTYHSTALDPIAVHGDPLKMALNLAKSNLTKPDGTMTSSTTQMFTIDKLLYTEKKEKRSAFAFCNEKRRTSFESLKFDASMNPHHAYPDIRHHDFSRVYSLGWTDPWFRMVRNGTHPYFTSLPDVGVHRGHGFKPMKSETTSKPSSHISSKPTEEELRDDDAQLVFSATDLSPPKEEKQTISVESRQRLPIKKKTRTVFSRAQVFHLEAAFDLKRYLSSSERTSLAAALRLSETQIKVWFQNRRNKWKRQFTTDPDSCAALCPDPKALPITIFGRDAAYLAAVDAMAKKEHSMLYSALTH